MSKTAATESTWSSLEGRESQPNCHIPILGTEMPKMGIKRATTKSGKRPMSSKAPRARTGGSSTSGLTDALFSSTQQRVLSLLFGHPERSYFATELIRLARSGSGAVQRELHRLEQSGLVTVSQQGNQKHYQANADAPIFPELRSIVLKTVGLAEPLRAALVPIEHQASTSCFSETSMPLPQLDNLVRARQLKSESAVQSEIDGLVRSGTARLADARRDVLSLDSRFDLAYNAAHAFSLAALRWHGYRSEHRYTVFQCLEHTVKLPAEQ